MSKASRRNRATIYSNGIADFQRIYKVSNDQPRAISLPVKEDHLADVLASLTVYGNVQIESPPSFRPDNHQDSNIAINRDDSFVSLAKQLTGSAVTIIGPNKKKTQGTLLGIDQQQTGTEGQPIIDRSLVVMSGAAIERVSMTQVMSLHFDDPVIQAEIEKALNRHLRQIKPNSTFVDFILTTKKAKSDAIVQYTIPAAAWKITYRLLQSAPNSFTLQGHAIVDNNTEEDWQDFDIAVVMGQPVTFSTDLATRKIPDREHVDIVQESAVGAVVLASAPVADAMEAIPRGSRLAKRNLVSESQSIELMEAAAEQLAEAPQSEVSESGDFCVFESSVPVSIDAHRSAVLPVFQTDLDEAKAYLHFKTAHHTDRPFRVIRLTNTTGHSLGRGVCTVYDGDTYAGSCVLPATKPDDFAFLPHALETGVRVTVHSGPVKRRRVGVTISAGVAYDQNLNTTETRYVIQSSQKEPFSFLLDHVTRISNANFDFILVRENQEPESLTPEELVDGRRCEFQIHERETLTITVAESAVTQFKIQLVGENWHDKANVRWLFANLVETDSPLADNEMIRQAVDLNRQLSETNDQISHAKSEVERLTNRQERLRKNIKTGGGVNQDEKWRNDLARAEDAIVQLEDERMPDLVEKGNAIAKQLYDVLKRLALEWSE